MLWVYFLSPCQRRVWGDGKQRWNRTVEFIFERGTVICIRVILVFIVHYVFFWLKVRGHFFMRGAKAIHFLTGIEVMNKSPHSTRDRCLDTHHLNKAFTLMYPIFREKWTSHLFRLFGGTERLIQSVNGVQFLKLSSKQHAKTVQPCTNPWQTS